MWQSGSSRALVSAFTMPRYELLGGDNEAFAARAQSAKNVRRVGILWPAASPPAPPRLESFREGLREAGFVEGENLVIELRYSKTGLQHLPELAAELVR